jgi:hypothetical protein
MVLASYGVIETIRDRVWQDSEQSNDGKHARTIESCSDDRQVEMKASNVLRKVLWEIGILRGQCVKWTDIKGVRVMRAAMSAGVSEKLLGELRPHLQSTTGFSTS